MTWNSEDEADGRHGPPHRRGVFQGFFLQHFIFAAQKVGSTLPGLPDEATPNDCTEIAGLLRSIPASPRQLGAKAATNWRSPGRQAIWPTVRPVLAALKSKFRRACFSVVTAATR